MKRKVLLALVLSCLALCEAAFSQSLRLKQIEPGLTNGLFPITNGQAKTMVYRNLRMYVKDSLMIDSAYVYETTPFVQNGDTVGITVKSKKFVRNYVWCEQPTNTILINNTYSQLRGSTIVAGHVGFHTNNPEYPLDMANTDAILIPKGTSTERPYNLQVGIIRFNTTNSKFEGYDGNIWRAFGATTSYTQASGTNSAVQKINHNGTAAFGVNIVDKDGIRLPIGSILDRPYNEAAGILRYNLQTQYFEYYDGTQWRPVAEQTYNDNTIGTSISNGIAINKSNSSYALDVAASSAIRLPRGTTTERPANPISGVIRFNTSTSKLEGFDGTNWICL